MADDMNTYRAFLAARNCAECLHTAHDVPSSRQYYTEYAIEQAQKLAALLGYVLVKREPAKEPAEEAA